MAHCYREETAKRNNLGFVNLSVYILCRHRWGLSVERKENIYNLKQYMFLKCPHNETYNKINGAKCISYFLHLTLHVLAFFVSQWARVFRLNTAAYDRQVAAISTGHAVAWRHLLHCVPSHSDTHTHECRQAGSVPTICPCGRGPSTHQRCCVLSGCYLPPHPTVPSSTLHHMKQEVGQTPALIALSVEGLSARLLTQIHQSVDLNWNIFLTEIAQTAEC